MRIVLDVNVWISGLLWVGIPGRIFDLAEEQKITIFVSEPIQEDIQEILGRKKLQAKIESLGVTIEDLLVVVRQLSELCPTVTVDFPQLRDPDDAVILATALAANAEVIVTGDLDLLVLMEFNVIPILTPQDFLNRYFPDML
ncbi:putative toxin-antitoxin system toxin component, PIN family [Nostoc sp. LPT]|uniref:putative toxin-antitoxin system toxin component, PIN family n=1 Tax=Nostoc sp. LPT TaxID=2815387 RepID=UPI001DC0D056|nr:putative toxin-antitoxin system toxin component, PIN family [Nostoc sp. LPT]MBN4001791.1 putative toxin-antitoxin system toxin component, PIN family [Nostoc sp. LPT]